MESLRRRNKQRGLALVTVIGLLLVLLVFAGGMVGQLGMEVYSVKTHAVANRALAAADAGVHAMVEQIQYNTAKNLPPPAGAVTYSYPEPAGTPVATSYSSTIDATWQAQGLNYYLITSIGTFNSPPFEYSQRKVRAIARSQPIGAFASFSNYEVNKYGNPVWYLSTQYYNGPVYSGGPMRIAYQSGAPTPIFGVKVTTGNNPVWSPATPAPTDWSSIVNGGQPDFLIDKNALSLPQPADNIYVASEAWEGDGTNKNPFVLGKTSSGLFIDGSSSWDVTCGCYQDAATTSASTITTGVFVNVAGGSGTVAITSTILPNTEILTFHSPSFSGGDYVLTENFTGQCTGSTTVTHGSSSHTFVGVPCGAPGPGVTNPGNGAIFVEGNIQFGRPATPDVTLQGDYAFTTPDFPTFKNNITLMGNLKYSDPTQDKVSLWANDVILNTNTTSGIEIDASIIAGYPTEKWSDGNFSSSKCGPVTCGPTDQGTLLIKGGLIENERGAVGVIIGGKQFGFHRVIDFDPRFTTSPPPFNPMTGNLSIIAWEDLGS